MKNKKMISIVAAAIILFVVAYVLLKPEPEEAPTPIARADRPCPGDTVSGVMPDEKMHPKIEKDQKINIIENWYDCHAPEKGDVVYYRYSTTSDPVVRVVRAVSGDEFEVLRDAEVGAWNLKVNGKLLMNESSDKPYYFGAKPPATLSLYEKANKGILQKGDIIVFSNVPPGSFDSGIFGVANVEDLVGKVEPQQ